MSKQDKAQEAPQEEAPKVPVDPATGKPYKSGEIPPGCNEPVP